MNGVVGSEISELTRYAVNGVVGSEISELSEWCGRFRNFCKLHIRASSPTITIMRTRSQLKDRNNLH